MTTQFNGRSFVTEGANTFQPTFEGGFSRRNSVSGSVMLRRTIRRERRQNRAI